jgi:hypothetical protein
LLETLLSFVIASATPEIVERVEQFHRRRHELGIYTDRRSPNVNEISASPLPIRSLEPATTPIPEIFRIEKQRAAGAHLAIRRPCEQVEKPGDYFTFDYRRREPVLHSRPRW